MFALCSGLFRPLIPNACATFMLHATNLFPILGHECQSVSPVLEEKGLTHKGGSGHVTIYYRGRKSQLPMHGGKKQLGSGLINKVKKDLGLED